MALEIINSETGGAGGATRGGDESIPDHYFVHCTVHTFFFWGGGLKTKLKTKQCLELAANIVVFLDE